MRQARMVTKEWDDITNDNSLKQMLAEVVTKVCQGDPAWSDQCVGGHELNA